MRFDDMLATLLAQPYEGAEARAALWRQLVDLLAQGRFTDDQELRDQALDYIVQLRARVSRSVKAETASAFIGRPLNMAALALFAEEPAPIIAPLIAQAQLGQEEWLTILPILTPTARGLLRHRRDLPAEVLRGLESFGHSDFAIAGEDIFESSSDERLIAAEDTIQPPEIADPMEDVQPDWPIENLEAGEPPFEEAEVVAAVAVALAHLDKAESIEPPVSIDGEAQIRELMARIEAYRAHDFVRPAETVPHELARFPRAVDDDQFRFETGADGAIIWAVGVARGAIIGETIAIAAHASDHGVDGYAAGAFRQRAPFRDARLTLAGDGDQAGEWRISGVPVFDPVDGRFNGYRGSARRPRLDEIAAPVIGAGLFDDVAAADSLRQLVHELRTPLNAIIGFSEMIEEQMLGPASTVYREKAGGISAQGRRLLSALEDLDLSARFEPQRNREIGVDVAQLLERLRGDYLHVEKERGFRLKFRIDDDLGLVAADPVAVERMFVRLLSGVLAVVEQGETIPVELLSDPDSHDRIILAIARPAMLAGRDERALLDPGYNPDGDWPEAPVLGLGFALRLVRNIASACGGALDIQPTTLILRLPLRNITARTGKG